MTKQGTQSREDRVQSVYSSYQANFWKSQGVNSNNFCHRIFNSISYQDEQFSHKVERSKNQTLLRKSEDNLLPTSYISEKHRKENTRVVTNQTSQLAIYSQLAISRSCDVPSARMDQARQLISQVIASQVPTLRFL